MNLPFEVAPWNHPLNYEGWQIFRVGTCHGQWRAFEGAYEILGIINDQPGNGHFQETMRWFEQSCLRDGYVFRIREVWNKELAAKLLKHRFVAEGDDMVKRFGMRIITLIGGPRNDEVIDVASSSSVFRMLHQFPATQDEPAKLVEINYIRVPGQDKYYIFEPYYKHPQL